MPAEKKKQSNRIIYGVGGGILALFLMLMALAFHDTWQDAMRKPWAFQKADAAVNWRVKETGEPYRITEGNTVSETLVMAGDVVSGIEIKFVFEDVQSAAIRIELVEESTGRIVQSWDRDFGPINATGFTDFLSEPVEVRTDESYRIDLTAERIDGGAIYLPLVSASEPVVYSCQDCLKQR